VASHFILSDSNTTTIGFTPSNGEPDRLTECAGLNYRTMNQVSKSVNQEDIRDLENRCTSISSEHRTYLIQITKGYFSSYSLAKHAHKVENYHEGMRSNTKLEVLCSYVQNEWICKMSLRVIKVGETKVPYTF
jgi:hypothetical protein